MAYANRPPLKMIVRVTFYIISRLRCSGSFTYIPLLAFKMKQNFIPKRVTRSKQFQAAAGLFACAVFCLSLAMFFVAQTAHAQMRGEALWRVESEVPSQQVPLYDGQPSPFPIKEPPPPPEPEEEEVAQAEEQEPELTPEQRLAQQRTQRAASLMSRIREILKQESAFAPDLSVVVIEAIVSGQAGDMALIRGKWFFEGDYIETPVQTANNLLTLMSGLEQADENLAEIVQEEVETKLAEAGPERVLIREIAEDGVTLRLPDGHNHVISFNSQGW